MAAAKVCCMLMGDGLPKSDVVSVCSAQYTEYRYLRAPHTVS